MYRDIRPDGEILESFGEGSTDYAYTGEMYDPNTGLVFLSARYYNPTDGRYMSKDQWYGFAKNSQSMNRWNYVGANPIMRTDATGRCYGPAEFLRNFEPGICQALDQSIFIYAYPNSTPEQVVAASFYISAWAVSHSALLVGAGALGAAKIASAGVSSYVLQLALTYPTVTNMLISSGVVLSSVDDLMVIYAGLTGDEEDQQRAAELAILAS